MIYKRIFFDDIVKEVSENYSDAIFLRAVNEYRLIEKTFNIDQDVNLIYKTYFKKYIDNFQKNDILPPFGKYGVMTSSRLKSKKSKEANKLYPVKIICGSFRDGNYNNFNSGNEVIQISLNVNAIENIRGKDRMPPNMKRSIENEISEHKTKTTIYHELSHWIGDALHNSYLHKLVARANSISKDDPDRVEKVRKIMRRGKADVNMTAFEVDAQIHGIKQIKKLYRSEWDTMTLVDLFYRYNSLKSIAYTLHKMSPDIYKEWVKDLVKRMHRENLLGKNMRNFPEYKMLEKKICEQLMRV